MKNTSHETTYNVMLIMFTTKYKGTTMTSLVISH